MHVLKVLIMVSIVSILFAVCFGPLLYFDLYVLILVLPFRGLPWISKGTVLHHDATMYRIRGPIILKGSWGAFFRGGKRAVAVFTSGLLPNRVLVAKHLCGDSATAERVTLCEEFFPLVKVGGPTSTK